MLAAAIGGDASSKVAKKTGKRKGSTLEDRVLQRLRLEFLKVVGAARSTSLIRPFGRGKRAPSCPTASRSAPFRASEEQPSWLPTLASPASPPCPPPPCGDTRNVPLAVGPPWVRGRGRQERGRKKERGLAPPLEGTARGDIQLLGRVARPSLTAHLRARSREGTTSGGMENGCDEGEAEARAAAAEASSVKAEAKAAEAEKRAAQAEERVVFLEKNLEDLQTQLYDSEGRAVAAESKALFAVNTLFPLLEAYTNLLKPLQHRTTSGDNSVDARLALIHKKRPSPLWPHLCHGLLEVMQEAASGPRAMDPQQ
ncbi:hypothetical protein HPB47_027809 [Ixodes persulcatus]|uniref:Uncharacterized protein n=1 Tax=Ixodes persulcatus TaxID=34615 RepID=A0AC60PUY8_IXOPE|nr:hypothetical protein HPB47_027809 [Ixodes persulcatus]